MTSRADFIDASKVTSRRVKDLHHYWQSKCGAGTLPPRAAIDPTEIPRLLPYLVITEIEAEPMRIRYRLVGTQAVETTGWDFTNRYLDECGFVVEPLLLACYRRLVATRTPIFAYYEWFKKDWRKPKGAIGANECGYFPLSSDGVRIDMAIDIADPANPANSAP
ncbi:MAG TPA: PAS domain-containing protein [Dongiaceae bacterium]